MAPESKAIPTELLKEKLRNLKDYLPEESNRLYDFAGYLADRLEKTSEIVPEGLSLLVEQIFFDLKKGNIKKIPVSLQERYADGLLRTQIPKIARAVCPDDFAEAILEIHREMYKRR